MNKDQLTGGKVIGSVILSILGMSVGQMIAMLILTIFSSLWLPAVIGNMVAGGIYIGITYYLLKLICERFLKVEMKQVRIGKFKGEGKWIAAAVLLPAIVILAFLCVPGRWEQSIFEKKKIVDLLTLQIFLYGMGGGIVEEMTFRGVIMSTVDRKWGKKAAILIPSIVFALGHVAAKPLDDISFWLLLAAGISVSIMFSLVAYESGTIWCGALIHAVWNACIAGGFMNIGTKIDPGAVYSYILDVSSPLITGGNYGIESSIISVAAYLAAAAIAWLGIRKKKAFESL